MEGVPKVEVVLVLKSPPVAGVLPKPDELNPEVVDPKFAPPNAASTLESSSRLQFGKQCMMQYIMAGIKTIHKVV